MLLEKVEEVENAVKKYKSDVLRKKEARKVLKRNNDMIKIMQLSKRDI